MSFRIHQTVVTHQYSNDESDSNHKQLQDQVTQLQDQLSKAKAKLAATPFTLKVPASSHQNEVVLLSVSPCPSPRASPRK